MDNTVFSHRPAAGISVGARNEGSKLFVSYSLVNDGTSRNGIFWRDRHDIFSRAVGRNIINGRINDAIKHGSGNDYVFVYKDNITAQEFMQSFRCLFKPDHDETDNLFISRETIDGVDIKYRLTGLEIAEKIRDLADSTVLHLSTVESIS